jgi:hypothetical protein
LKGKGGPVKGEESEAEKQHHEDKKPEQPGHRDGTGKELLVDEGDGEQGNEAEEKEHLFVHRNGLDQFLRKSQVSLIFLLPPEKIHDQGDGRSADGHANKRKVNKQGQCQAVPQKGKKLRRQTFSLSQRAHGVPLIKGVFLQERNKSRRPQATMCLPAGLKHPVKLCVLICYLILTFTTIKQNAAPH